MEIILDKLHTWYENILELTPNIIGAILVLVAFVFLSRLMRKLILKILKKTIDNEAITRLMSNIGSFLILMIGLFIILGILNLDKAFTSLLAGAGIAGLALGLAFQEPVINLLSGIDLASRRTYELGDLVETNGYMGFVDKIALRTTKLKTLDGQDLIIPNKQIAQNPFINYTHTDIRRIDLKCGISYNSNLKDVEKTAIEAISQLDGVLKEKGIYFFYTDFGDSGINFVMQFWCSTAAQNAFLNLRHKAITTLKSAFDEKQITIPYPTRTVLTNPESY